MSYPTRTRSSASGTPVGQTQMLPPPGYKPSPQGYAYGTPTRVPQQQQQMAMMQQAQMQQQQHHHQQQHAHAQAQAAAMQQAQLAQLQAARQAQAAQQHQQQLPPGYSRQQAAPHAGAAAAPRQHVQVPMYHFPASYPAGPMGFFLPPPGQITRDPTYQTPPTSQALYTTYPARLRTGVTQLLQPENVTGGPREREHMLAELDRELAGARSSGTNTPRIESPAPTSSRRNTTTVTLSGRRAGRVNYAEKEESEEESSEEDIDEAPSDPDDDTFGERRRRRDALDRERQDRHVQERIGRIKKKHSEMERGWTWLGDRVPAERVRSEVARVTKHKYYPEHALERQADQPEMLVPITIDYDVPSPTGDGNGIKIKDRFLWNAADAYLKPIEFATILCEDIGLAVQPHANTIADLILTQIEEAQGTVVIDLQTDDATPDDVLWSDEEDMHVDEESYPEPDCRIIINLDVQIFTHVLRDRIEWDLSSPLPPSEFARHYCAELGLSGEAIPLIAHAIHEELIKHKRDALELDLFAYTHPSEQAKWEKGGAGAQGRATNRQGARALVGVWRDWWERDDFQPQLVELSTEEMERREVERSREARRMMRTLATSKRRR